MMLARETGQPFDAGAFLERVHSAVSDVVRKQIDSGVDVVSDGEQGKPGFANYVGDWLTGIVTREGARPARGIMVVEPAATPARLQPGPVIIEP